MRARQQLRSVSTLHRRIEKRFPGSGLGKIAAELQGVAEETVTRTRWIQKPHLPLRCAAAILSLLAFLTFSPCEGFLLFYVSGIRWGWSGFVLLTAVLSIGTVAGMIQLRSSSRATAIRCVKRI